MVAYFNLLVHQPLYNALVYLLSVIPHADAGIAVVCLTVLVRILLYPFAKQAILTQITLRRIGPEIEDLREKYKDDQQEQVKRTLALYKQNHVHPLSGFLVILIQVPVVIGLYIVFAQDGFSELHVEQLYRFIVPPQEISMLFFGLFDLGGKSVVFAVIAGAAQFIHARFILPPPILTKKPGESFKEDMMKSLHVQMVYVLPVVITVIAYITSAPVALYWATSNVLTIFQELWVRTRYGKTTGV